MIKKNRIWLILTILLFGVFLLQPVTSALTVTSVNIDQNYANTGGNLVYKVFVTVDDSTGVSSIPLQINSIKQTNKPDSPIDFNAINPTSNVYEADFYLDFDSDTSSISSDGLWPKVIVNPSDTITVSLKSDTANKDTMIVDSVPPVIGIISFVAPLGSENSGYYKGDVNVSIVGYSDANTYIKNYIAYVVPVDKIDTFSTDYVKKVVTDNNYPIIDLGVNTGVADGNYFVVVDAVDIAGNNGIYTDVKDTNYNIYIDNSAPIAGSFNLGSVPINNNSIYYIDTNKFDLNITSVVDSGVGININNPPTKITMTLPNTALVSNMENYTNFNTDINGFYISINTSYDDGNMFHVVFDINDMLNNNLHKDFNVMIDSKGPTTPTKPTLTRAIDNNITVANWGSSTDAGSGLLTYKVYRSTSNFTEITNQTLICTVEASGTKSCVDSSSKSDDTTYYYGVVAIDKLNNLSTVETESIKTGPKFSFNIAAIDNGYTNLAKPTIDIKLDSDINEVRFSCNGSTFTSWVDVSGSSESYSDFDITTGSGCSTDNGLKKIYVQAKSSDSPYLVSQKTNSIRYDNIAPAVPINVKAIAQSDGSLKLTWSTSSDSGVGLDKYYIYYSKSFPVTTADKYYVSLNNSYNFRPNEDGNYSIRIISIDKLGNTSALSSEVSGITKRVGPTFTLNINPQVDVNGTKYVKAGNTTFRIISDENLKSAPKVSLKIGTGSEIDLTPSFSNNIATVSYNLTTSGLGTLKVSGVNEKNEQASNTFNFAVDANAPTFDVNYTINKSIYNFDINGYSDDVTKAQYILDNTNSLCIITSGDYNCSFDSIDYNDGAHTVSVLVYDKALNVARKNISINIDNINEDAIVKQKLVKSVSDNVDLVNSNMNLYNAISINLSKDANSKYQEVKQKQHEIQQLQDSSDLNIYNSAVLNKLYIEQNTLLSQLDDLLPKISVVKNKAISVKYDSNYSFDLNTIVSDANILSDTNSLYNSNTISVDRNFMVVQIENNKYYLVDLVFNNSSDSPKTITFIETTPKDISSNVADLLFNSKVNIINKDPIAMNTITIPAKSSFKFEYTKKSPITDFTTVSKFDIIKFQNPIILDGNVSSDNIDIVVPSNDIYTLLIILVVILLLLIIIVAVSSKKKKKKTLGLDVNKAKEESLSGKSDPELSGQTQENIPKDDDVTKNDNFQSNYDYIVDAVKRNNR